MNLLQCDFRFQMLFATFSDFENVVFANSFRQTTSGKSVPNGLCPPVQLTIIGPVTLSLCVAMTTLSVLQATSVVIMCACA